MPSTSAPTATRPTVELQPVAEQRMSIAISPDGPYLVSGGVPLIQQVIMPTGGHYEYRTVRTFPPQEEYALCRCGHSNEAPFCDGAHRRVGFDGAETASRAPFDERADVYPGPRVALLDDGRCAFARFCHREDGDAWTLTELSFDERLEREAVKASSDCPAGRLVHVDALEGTRYEPRLKPSIAVLEDVEEGVGGPLFVRGGIPLASADGSEYELRNRYALCRCGASGNKPFCNAMHAAIGFDDGLKERAAESEDPADDARKR